MPSPRLGGRGGGNRRHRRAMEVMEEAGTELMVVEADAMEEVEQSSWKPTPRSSWRRPMLCSSWRRLTSRSSVAKMEAAQRVRRGVATTNHHTLSLWR
jgi:hypothetical protein